ncbi:MAG: hypothetical protein JWM76_65 [Pseudonocardiales bacterium]|nr:hypothetical protein [Pseudonocardiales bacterium]
MRSLEDDLAKELGQVTVAAAEAGARTSLGHWHRRSELTVDTKLDLDDLVTQADVQTQVAVFDVIRGRRPNDRLRGEEMTRAESRAPKGENKNGIEWWVDPIDGTTSFVYGRSDWSVSVAAVDGRTGSIVAAAVSQPVLGILTTAVLGLGAWCHGQRLVIGMGRDLARALVDINLGTHAQRTVAGEMVDRLATRSRDIRRGGSAALALVNVAAGRADAAWVPGLQAWDGAAGMLIAHEAGAIVGDLNGATGPRWPASGDVLAAPPPLFHELQAILAPAYGASLPRANTH